MTLRLLAILSFAATLAVTGDTANIGAGIDPNGGDCGSLIDPMGVCHAANIDKGMGVDPNG